MDRAGPGVKRDLIWTQGLDKYVISGYTPAMDQSDQASSQAFQDKLIQAQLEIRRARAIAWNRAHRETVRARSRAYYQKHKARIQREARAYARTHAEQNRTRQIEWRKIHPWYNIWQQARTRALARGIDFSLTKDDMRFIWVRDVTLSVIGPCLIRIDTAKGYAIDNCKIIGRSEAGKLWIARAKEAKTRAG